MQTTTECMWFCSELQVQTLKQIMTKNWRLWCEDRWGADQNYL